MTILLISYGVDERRCSARYLKDRDAAEKADTPAGRPAAGGLED